MIFVLVVGIINLIKFDWSHVTFRQYCNNFLGTLVLSKNIHTEDDGQLNYHNLWQLADCILPLPHRISDPEYKFSINKSILQSHDTSLNKDNCCLVAREKLHWQNWCWRIAHSVKQKCQNTLCHIFRWKDEKVKKQKKI